MTAPGTPLEANDLSGHVTFENRSDGVHCVHADPVIWFTDVSESPLTAYNPWTVEGDCFKLNAANGTWVWKLTGRELDWQCGSKTVRRREAVWPD